MQDPNETFNNIEQNTEMALLQSEKIAESVNELEPIMEGVLVKTDEMVQEMKKNNDKPVNETKIIFEGVEMTEIRGRDGKDGEKGEKGDKGERGERGEQGEKGEKGDKGDRGEDGINGYDGRDGLDGYDGKDGKDGIDGRDGVDGKDGKDGTEIKPEEIKQKLESLEVGLDYEKLSNIPDIAKIARVASSKTVSLVELDDVDYSGLTKTNGKYVLGGGTWGSITGTLSNQTDLQSELDTKIESISVDGTSITGDGVTTPLTANFTQTGKYMISGGATWSGTGLVYDVSFLNYFFEGLKTANASQVTLDASDPTNNRIDAIVVDEAGTVSVITGDPSSSPVEPPIPEDQLQVQFILVEAGSVTPTIASEEIYMDDPTTDWTFTTYDAASPATGTIDFAGTSSPKQGTECIEASTDLRRGARFVRSTSFDAYQYTMFSVWVRFTGTAVAANKALNVRFENSAGTLVGNTVNLFSYGLSRSILNTWQLVVIPITAFGALPATVKGLKIIMAGGTVGAVRQWDIDYMILTNGSIPSANVPTIAFYRNGTGIASQTGLNIVQGTGMTITAANDPTNGRVNYTFNAAGGSPAGSDTQIQYNNAGAFGADSGLTFNQTTNTFTATNSWEVFRSEIKFQSNGGSDDLSASSATSFTGTPPTIFAVLAYGNIQIVNYINLVGGNFSQGDTITGSVSGAEGYVAYDDGVGQFYVSITNSIQFAATDVIDNANGVTADYDTSTTSDDIFFWFSTNGGSGGPIVITGTAQTLNDGIDITFGSTTGHGAGDSWQWSYKTLKNTLLTNRIVGAGALSGAINGQYFKSGSGSSIIQSMNGFFQNGDDDRIFPLSYYEDLTGSNSDKERAYYGLSPFKNDPSEPLEFSVYTRKGIGLGPSDISTFSVSSLTGIRMESDKIVYIDSPLFQVEEQIFSWTGNTNSTGITIDDTTQRITMTNVPTFTDEAAAITGGLTTGQIYKSYDGQNYFLAIVS